MADAQTILVVFLSTALAIFLVLGIILLVFLIEIVQRIKRMSEKAERIADKAESAADAFHQITASTAAGKIIATIVSLIGKKTKSKEEREE